jgi:cinnamyl-alcohol dehydrogenase
MQIRYNLSDKESHFLLINLNFRYCFQIPDGYPLAKAAPLLCAGITVYTPMMRHNMNQPGKSLGVIGLGGLGHMAVKFGKAFGLKVTVLSTSESKRHEAISLLGADNFVISSDTQQMEVLPWTLHNLNVPRHLLLHLFQNMRCFIFVLSQKTLSLT